MAFKGPTLRASRHLPDGAVELTFADVAGGLARAAAGRCWASPSPARTGASCRRAEIVGRDRVRVWSEAVARPAALRYAWGDTPLEANLVDGAGLPASPCAPTAGRWSRVTFVRSSDDVG
jgi:sialate O-acetylesterase